MDHLLIIARLVGAGIDSKLDMCWALKAPLLCGAVKLHIHILIRHMGIQTISSASTPLNSTLYQGRSWISPIMKRSLILPVENSLYFLDLYIL